jgi:hypothetical protein
MKLSGNILIIALAGWLPAALATSLMAQEEVVENPPVVAQSMILSATSSDGDAMPQIQVLSTMDGGGAAMFVADGMVASPDIFSLAGNPGVQKEIELVDEQLQQIRTINEEFSKKISEQVKELTSGGMNPEKGKDLSKLIQELNEQKKAKMEGVLLPHQFDRLRQISLQMQMKNSGEAATLASEQVAEALGLTDEQKERLEKRSEDLKKELEEKIAKLKDKAREDLLSELTRDQRKKLDEMTGNKFDLQTPDFGSRIRQMRRARDAKNDSDK